MDLSYPKRIIIWFGLYKCILIGSSYSIKSERTNNLLFIVNDLLQPSRSYIKRDMAKSITC